MPYFKKSLGQHFLVDKNVLAKIISTVNPQVGEVIIEIGAGRGALTQYLLETKVKLISIEIDKHLVEYLHEKFGKNLDFEIIEEDALKINYEVLFKKYGEFRVVGNIPYNITSPLIFKMIDNRDFIRDVHFMVQKDVAERLVAMPGAKEYGLLSVILGFVANVKKNFDVSRNCFRPVPEVDSSFVSIFFKDLELEEVFFEKFKRIVKAAFGKRRKMLRNSLREFVPSGEEIDFDLSRRPDSMGVEDFVKLTRMLWENIAL